MSTNFALRKYNKSKIYSDFIQNVAINNDQNHLNFTCEETYEQKNILEKKKIDKIMQGTIKERLFSRFTVKDSYMNNMQVFKMNQICKEKFSTIDVPWKTSRKIDLYSTVNDFTEMNSRKSSAVKHMNSTLHVPSTSLGQRHSKNLQLKSKDKLSLLPIVDPAQKKQRNMAETTYGQFRGSKTQRLSKAQKHVALDRTQTGKPNKSKGSLMLPSKKLQINLKTFGEIFKKWFTKDALLNDIKLTREILVSKLKHLIDPKILQRFFYFFNFPQSFGVRQFVSYLQNAANTNLRFIYFWIFITLDEVSNGVLNYQDLFQFLQKFPQANPYIEDEIYLLVKQIKKNNHKNIQQSRDIQIPPQQMLTVNRNLRIDQLQGLLKQTAKDRIQVNCVKNTYYHQTILSLQHDTLERLKMSQIEDNQLATQSLKNQMLETKAKMDSIKGIRLRNLPLIFNGKRPKIFCYVLHLLGGVRPQDYQ